MKLELSGFGLRLIVVCGRGRAAMPRLRPPAVAAETIKLASHSLWDAPKSSLLSGDNPSLFTGNHTGLCLEVLFR